jgi:hypothetical protein
MAPKAESSEGRDAGGRFVEGRPTLKIGIRTPENALRICELIIQGMNLDDIGKAIGANGRSTILMWVAQDAEFEAMYRRAKAAQADALGEDIIAIADDGRNDLMTVTGAHGKEYEITNREVVLRSKLRVDSRFRLMAALAPKRYGQKIEVEHDVSDSFADRLVRARERAAALTAPVIIDHEAAE